MDAALLAKIVGFVGAPDPRPSKQHHVAERTQTSTRVTSTRVRAVIFSKDRPFQLRCLLRSIDDFVVGVAETVVIWTGVGYDTLINEFPAVDFQQEGDFERLLTAAARDVDYVLVCVDDAFLCVVSRACHSHAAIDASTSAMPRKCSLTATISWPSSSR